MGRGRVSAGSSAFFGQTPGLPAVMLVLFSFQVSRILKVAKPNFVVMKLLAGGHKKESKVSMW